MDHAEKITHLLNLAKEKNSQEWNPLLNKTFSIQLDDDRKLRLEIRQEERYYHLAVKYDNTEIFSHSEFFEDENRPISNLYIKTLDNYKAKMEKTDEENKKKGTALLEELLNQ